MIVFAHLHKAAGTTIVNAAIKSGMRLPDKHANGHPIDADGRYILLDEMQQEEIRAFFSTLQGSEVEFLAIEWGWPRFEHLAGIPGLRFLTVLRDPLDRAISNFRMDVVHGYAGDAVFGFDAYTKESTAYCASNYYVRYFCGLGHSAPVTIEHYNYVRTLLSKHFRTLVLGKDDLSDALRDWGFEKNQFSHDNALTGSTKFSEYNGLCPLGVTEEDAINFISRNGFDLTLFRFFMRSGQID